MYESKTPLCCCEYVNIDQQRSHILACCCNCQDLDESFESLITRRPILRRNREGLMSTLQDRMRIPWCGGARQFSCDAILPIILVPSSLLCAAYNLYATIIVTLIDFLLFLYIYHTLPKYYPKSKFFLIWTIITIIIQYIIFEFIVVPLLEILYEENIIVGILIFFSIGCAFVVIKRTSNLQDIQNGFIKSENGRGSNCHVCQIPVPDCDHHNVWLDCCIGQHNQGFFVLTLVFSTGVLLYSSNLTLTSVCHPFTFYKSILLPDDCSDVYEQYELGIAFVSALYSILLGLILFLVLLHQIVIITLGISTLEWRNFKLNEKICCFCANRPYSRGFLKNWLRIFCFRQREY